MTQDDSTIVGWSWFFDSLFSAAYSAHLILSGHMVITRSGGRWPSRRCCDQTCSDPFLRFVTLSHNLFASLIFFALFCFVTFGHFHLMGYIGVCSEIVEFLSCTSVPEVMSLRSCGTFASVSMVLRPCRQIGTNDWSPGGGWKVWTRS